MFSVDLFRSFVPTHNPLGFGASDFLELAFTAVLLALVVAWQPWLKSAALWVARKPLLSMALLAVLPVALRLALLPHHPVPSPDVYDEFSHLLVADTLRHLRFANPPHAFSRFFETFFVLQAPTYSSIYPLGQGMALAFGRFVFGYAWAGVLFEMALFCTLTFWMLRAWTTPLWSLIGGLLAVIEFGPLNLWTNDYWGGGLPAVAGCLVFGAIPRFQRHRRRRDAVLLGIGLAIHLLCRPYETVFLFLAAGIFLFPVLRKGFPKALLSALMPLIAALGVTLLQNRQVTGDWLTLPYRLSQNQYGVPAALTFQPDPVPHRLLTPEQQMDYKMQTSFRAGPETLRTFLIRLAYRARFYRFFFLAPLYLALPFFLLGCREFRFAAVAVTLLVFALGVNFFPAFQFHYMAACTALFILVSVTGLERLTRFRPEAALVLLGMCVAHFGFWYAMHLLENKDFSLGMRRFETWNSIDHQDPDRRRAVNEALAHEPGPQLVFVQYWPNHIFQQEWVWNEADIDHARVVWARDLGPSEDARLIGYYPARKVWLLEPDARPPRLRPYQVPPPVAVPDLKPALTKSPFEEVK